MAETEKPTMSRCNLNILIMKKLEDFSCEKVEINSIYGGNEATFDQDTVTIGANCSSCDGSDEGWDN